MRIAVWVASALFLLSSSAGAHLEDTETDIDQLYGKPVIEAEVEGFVKSVPYAVADMIIVVKFEGGISRGEGYSKKDRSAISTEEIVTFLSANEGGHKWMFPGKSIAPGVLKWRSEDRHSRVAVYRARERALFITTQDFLDRAKKRLQSVGKQFISTSGTATNKPAQGKLFGT